MQKEDRAFFNRMISMMVYTRKALSMIDQPVKKNRIVWKPLLEGMEVLARHRRLNSSGIEALRTFTDMWDTRIQQLEEGKNTRKHQPLFPLSLIREMARPLADYERWLRINFPEVFLPTDNSLN
jgi:hypothetical protein